MNKENNKSEIVKFPKDRLQECEDSLASLSNIFSSSKDSFYTLDSNQKITAIYGIIDIESTIGIGTIVKVCLPNEEDRTCNIN
jgi:hypothetical protein